MKILKNTTASDVFIDDVGISLLANSNYIITDAEILLWVASISILPFVLNGDIVVNNNSIDLPPNEGVRFLQYPDRITVKKDNADVTRVVTNLDFTGNVTVTDNGNGKATINVTNTEVSSLREITTVPYSFGTITTESNLLFEVDLENDTILFLKEESI